MQNNNKDNKSIVKYGLNDIQILEFNLLDVKEENIEQKELSGNLGISGKYDEENNKVYVVINVDIEKKNITDSKLEKFGNLKIKYTFDVYGIEKIRDEDGGVLPKSLVDTFNAISISTTRGIIFTKFQATKLDNFILPLIDHNRLKINYEDV